MVQNLKSMLNDGIKSEQIRFNPEQLTFARTRRGLKKSELALRIGVTPRSITGYECGEFPPEPERLAPIATELRFPADFFYEEESIETVEPDSVSFRAMTKMGVT